MTSKRQGFLPSILASHLGRLVFVLNLAALLVLIIGAMVLNEFTKGLIETKKESLRAQAELMSVIISEVATQDDLDLKLKPGAAYLMLRFIEKGQRTRFFDMHGHLLIDSAHVGDDIDMSAPDALDLHAAPNKAPNQAVAGAWLKAQKRLLSEVSRALQGEDVAEFRRNDHDDKVVSVTIPIHRRDRILGVLQLESGGVDSIVARQRLALLPFIFVALLVNIATSLVLNRLVSQPVQRLSAAADSVRLKKIQTMELPDIEARRDEIGILARSLSSMTATLSDRMTEIERFAADVSHEIKNPLTSIRSALDTFGIVKDEAAKTKLMGVVKNDVLRLDRLITDISNASRLDAELSRDVPRPIDFKTLVQDVVSVYEAHSTGVSIVIEADADDSYLINGREGPLGQVLRNLIDNALSFSAPGGQVYVRLKPDRLRPARALNLYVEDEGLGIPDENLETIFERFYTSRPKGTQFGRNSGLGLAISRQIIEAHSGQIWAENRQSEDHKVMGARFCISLPRVA